jgi:hypothetical protein
MKQHIRPEVKNILSGKCPNSSGKLKLAPLARL